MTTIDPGLLVRLGNALQTPLRAERSPQRKRAGESQASREQGETATPEDRLLAALELRIAQMSETRAVSDEDLLLMAIQQTLVQTFGDDISAHPRFAEITRRIQENLAGLPACGTLLQRLARPGQKPAG